MPFNDVEEHRVLQSLPSMHFLFVLLEDGPHELLRVGAEIMIQGMKIENSH